MTAANVSVKSRNFLKRAAFCAGLLGFAVALQALSSWSDRHAFMINASESLPHWALFVESGQFPERGELVVFHPGDDSLTQEYFGEKPDPFTKIAYGVPGDVVARDGSDVIVNGEVIARLKPLTKRGDELHPGPLGEVPDGCVFAATPHPDGFDSRYSHIGFVCAHRIVGTGVPIL